MKKWHSENFEFQKDTQYEAAGGGFVWINTKFLPDEIKRAEYGPLFAYMYRRFGIPQRGSDDHKEIANWYITTPDPNVGLMVSPRPSGISHSFGYLINTGVYNERRDEKQKQKVEVALTVAMTDLLTPVFVRDVPINAVGLIPDDYDWENNEECDAWTWAGYAVPSDQGHYLTKFKKKGQNVSRVFNENKWNFCNR